VNTLDEFLRIVKKGERCVVFVPASTLADRLLELTLRSLNRLEQKTFVCTTGPVPDLPGTIKPAALISVADARNGQVALTSFKALLAKAPSTASMVIDWLAPSWIRSSSDFSSFSARAADAATRKGIRTIWLYRNDLCDPGTRALLADGADFLLHIQTVGLQPFAQFLKIKGVFEDDLFLPRRVRIIDTSVEFDPPAIPSLQAATGEGGVDVPVMTDLLDLSYRRVFETSPDGIVLFDLRGKYREANARALEILGRDAAELKAAPLAELVGQKQVWSVLRAAVLLKRKGKLSQELDLVRKSGRLVHVTLAASLVDRGRYMAVLHDLSGKVKEVGKLRESAAYYQGLFDNSSYPQAIIAARKMVVCNGAFRDTFAVSYEQSVEGKPLTEFLGKDIAGLMRDLYGAESRGNIGRSGIRRELTLAMAGGGDRRFEVSALPLPEEETRTYHLTFVDITTHHQLVKDAGASERRYRDLLETAVGAIAVVRDGKVLFVNQGFLLLFGYGSPGDIVGEDVTSIVVQRERSGFLERCEPANALGGAPTTFLYTGLRTDGTPLQVQLTGETIIYEGRHAFLSYHRDVTDQKGLDDQVRRKAHTYQILDSLAETLARSTAVIPLVQNAFEGLLRRLGYEAGGIYILDDPGKVFHLVTQTGLSEKILQALGEQPVTEGISGYVAKTHEALLLSPAEYPPYLPHRSLFESEQLSIIVYIPLVAGEMVKGIVLLTARKRQALQVRDADILNSLGRQIGVALERAMEYEKLQAAESLCRSTLDGLPQVTYQTTPSGAFTYLSPGIEGFVGYKPSEFFRNPDLWRSIVHPDDRSTYSLRVAGQSEGSLSIDYRIYPKGKAAFRRVRDSIRYTRNADGAVVSIQGIIADLAEERDRLASYVAGVGNTLQGALVVYDADLVCRSWNRSLEELTGLAADQMTGKAVTQASGFAVAEETLRRALGGETVATAVTVAGGEKDASRSVAMSFSTIRDRDGNVLGVSGVARNVSREGENEPEPAETAGRLREVINAMGDALMISDLELRIVEVNRAFTELTGYERSDVQGLQFPYPWLIDEETPRFVQWISELRAKRYLLDFDMTWRHKDGREAAISLNTTLFRNASGEPVAMLNIARDISERRRLANELATRSRQIEILNRIISKANQTVDFGEIFETIAKEVASLIPCHEINVGLLADGGKSMQVFACADEQGKSKPAGLPVPLDRTVSQLAIARRGGVIIGDIIGHPELGPRILSAREGFKSQLSIPIVLNEKILGALSVASRERNAFSLEHMKLLQPVADQVGSMIDRSRLFQQVNEDSRYIHTLLDSLESIVLTVDPDFRIREVNKAWREFADLQGLSRYRDESSVVGIPIEEVVTVPRLREELQRVMPQFFDRTLSFYATEVSAGPEPDQKTFQLVINPMAGVEVSGLVFTYTDITGVIRTEEEIRRRNEELLAFNAISSSISRSLNLDDVLDVAFGQIRDRLKAEVVLCYLMEKQGTLLQLARWSGVGDSSAGQIREIQIAPRNTPAPAGAWEPLLVDDTTGGDERITDSVRTMYETLQRRPLIAIPLQSKDHLLGALVIGFADGHRAQDHERRFLILLGNQLGSALENAQLYAELQEQFNRTTTLYELGKGLTGVLDSRGLMELVFKEVSRSLPLVEFRYEIFLDRASMLRTVFRGERRGDGEVRLTYESAERALEPASAEWAVVTTMVPHLHSKDDPQPLMMVPVRRQRKVAGLITVKGAKGSPYSRSYLRLLESIGNLVEIVLDRVVLYEDTVAKSHEIEARNRELDDFAYVVSHDLKEPLITIEGYSKIVLGEYKDRVNDEGLQFLSSIVQSSARMKGLIEDLLTLSRVGRVTDSTESVQVTSVLEDAIRDFDFTLMQRGARVDFPPDLPTVRYNATQLSMVFRNLISNAIKFNLAPEPTVTISVKEEPSEFQFAVRDNGIGIAKEHFDRIFVIFQRLNRAEEYQGTGAGLTIVRKIIERHGGRIWLESEEGKGTTFYFTVPK
jgi:PAS domain S-box-containing protein